MTMPRAPRPLSSDAVRPFRYVSGDAALDLVNTVVWTADGLVRDRLTDYPRVLDWARGAGLLDAAAVRRFRAAGADRPLEAAAATETVRAFRHVLRRLVVGAAGEQVRDDSAPELAAALEAFDECLRQAGAHLRVAFRQRRRPRTGLALRWSWEGGAGDPPESAGRELLAGVVVWPAVRAAAALLTSDEVASIRMCGGDECGWVFVDRSRNRLRRWCEMETCGTRAKEARRGPRTRSQ